ncbi:MAG: type II toxin-antitoxin system ParD family antitoxin [Pseudomonadota bacterium]
MSVKASVSISDQQDAYVRRLVAEGRYASVSAVVQRGLELVREEAELKEAELAALKGLIEDRMKGPFLDMDQARAQTEALIARKKKQYGV